MSAPDILKLPVVVGTRSELGRLLRELEAVDEFLAQASIREPGTPTVMPKISKAMQELATINSANLLDEGQRTKLINQIKLCREEAHVLHMSFAVEPSPAFVQKMVVWLRENIEPSVLLQVGLQPDIAAGCTLRTRNKYYDFSLRKAMKKHRDELVALVGGHMRQEEPQAQPEPAPEPVVAVTQETQS